MTDTYRDLHKQAQRLQTRINMCEDTSCAMAADLLVRALEKAARRPHSPTLQQDEYFCATCGSRWDKDEPAPETDCEPLPVIHDPVLRGDEWHCLRCPATWAFGEIEPKDGCNDG